MTIKSVSRLLILIAFLFMATDALSVTQPPLIQSDSSQRFVTTKLAERAACDVQIRRIKHLISKQKIDPDVAFDRWEKLQDQLRGR